MRQISSELGTRKRSVDTSNQITQIFISREYRSYDKILSREQAKIIGEGGGTKGNALQAMAPKGDCEAVSRLLDLGADMDNLRGQYGTPMMAVASNGKLEIFGLLIERGADVNKKDDRIFAAGDSATDLAAAHFHEKVVRELLDEGAVFTLERIQELYNKSSDTCRTLLQALSRKANSAALARLFLENGANVDAVADGSTFVERRRPLHLAVEYGEVVTLQVLLEYGADVNAKSDDSDGNTALHIVVQLGNLEKLGILLDHEVDIDATNAKGKTALFLGATRCPREKYRQVFHIPIEKGADIKKVDEDGKHSAHGYCQTMESTSGTDCGNVLVVKCLLQRRTSQYVEETGEVWNAVESATQNSRVETARVLLEVLSKTAVRDHQYLLSATLFFEHSKEVANSNMISLLAEYEATVVPLAQNQVFPMNSETRQLVALRAVRMTKNSSIRIGLPKLMEVIRWKTAPALEKRRRQAIHDIE